MCRFKGAVSLRIVTEGVTYECPLNTLRKAIMRSTNKNVRPAIGKANLCLRVEGGEVDLARMPGAFALMVTDKREAIVYWLKDGLCSEIEPHAMAGVAREATERRFNERFPRQV